MKVHFVSILLVNCLVLLCGFSARADVSGEEILVELALTSNYLDDGQSQSNEKPALQPFIEYINDGGVYFSALATNFDAREKESTSTELDLAFGLRWQETSLMALDVGIVNYVYFGGSGCAAEPGR